MAIELGNAGIVAQRILGMFRSEDFQKIGSVWGVHDELRKLENTISALAPLLLDAQKRAEGNDNISKWLQRLEGGEELDEAVNLLEDLASRAKYLQRGNKFKMPKQVCSFLSFSKSSKFNMGQKIKDINETLCKAEAEGREFGLEKRDDKTIEFPNGLEEALSFVVRGGVFSVRNSWDHVAKMEFISILLDTKFEQNVTVIPLIYSIWEIDVYLEDVFSDGRVWKHFQKRIWLSYNKNHSDEIEVLRSIVHHAADLKSYYGIPSSRDELERLLSSSLSGVRYLIVLIKKWNDYEDPDYWLFLIRVLMRIGGEKGSKIIVTTSEEELTRSIACTIEPYHLNCPSLYELGSLFKKVAFRQQPKNSYMTYYVVKKIVLWITGGSRLPLVTAAIGSMLYFKNWEADGQFLLEGRRIRSYDEINVGRQMQLLMEEEERLHNSASRLLNTDDEIYMRRQMRLLWLCYNHLPLPLKHCFVYCSLFPKYHEIDVQTTIKLWMAQGFIIDEPGKSLEEVGYEYFLNLLRRCFFQEPTIDMRRRVMIRCKMQPLMHDLANLLERSQCFLFSSGAFHHYRPHYSHVSFESGFFTAEVGKKFNNIRSFLSQSQLWEMYGGRHGNYEICYTIISRCRFLRALDLRAVGIKIVPSSIGELRFLKYLDLSENGDITKLPNSITKLLKLQTLKLSSCFRLRQLPKDIQNLINLRHLEIDGCYSLTSLPRRFGQLTNLRTLSQIVLSKDSSIHDAELFAVKGLVNLREEFQIKNMRHEKDVTVYLNAVPSGVRSLSLEWDSHEPKSYYNETPTEDGELAQDLEELSINGFRGVTLFSPSMSSKLVKLSLRRCWNCQNLPSFDQLLHLNELVIDELINLEYISNKDSSSASTTFFPCLQKLCLTELPKLQGWWKNRVEETSFPCLSKLVIEDCPSVASMPQFPTLEEGLVLDTTSWKPFQLTMKQRTIASEVSKSTSPPSAPLSKLKNLSIVGITDCKVDEIEWETLKSLRFLRFDCLPELTTLPVGLQNVTSLQELNVWRCGIKELPSWISKLELLKKLEIRVCPKLKSLPEEIQSLRSLQTIEIEDCQILLKRCEKEIEVDWNKIANIPNKRLGPIKG